MRAVVASLTLLSVNAMALSQVVGQLDKSVYEFWPDKETKAASHYSFALVNQPMPKPIEQEPTVRPTFGFTDDYRYSAEVTIPPDTDLYGTGENAGPLRRNGTVVECWNSDVPSYTTKNKSLYQSHPWVLAVRKDGTAFGVLADTTYRCRIDLTKDILFAAEGPKFPVIVIEGKTPQEVVMKLADLTGHMQLPPLWALGYHQSRWSYMSADEVLSTANEFRKRHIPCDTMWMDIDYMRGYRIFIFDPNRFPNPKGLTSKLAALHFHNAWILDPGVKVDADNPTYSSGMQRDIFVKDRLGHNMEGNVWPGKCVFPDFTMPEARAWWAGQFKPFLANEIDGIWNDMNEPSFFNVPTKTMPEEAVHRGGDGVAPGPHAEYHNVYGMQMARASYEAMKKANPDKRPFVLSRAGYIGSQRYAANWLGDTTSTWRDLHNTIPMILNLGLSGEPFVGADIPGFNENGPTDPQERVTLFSRWWSMGAMLPISRGHSATGTVRKEPWSFGPEVEDVARRALWRRYVLMPYLYTAFDQSSSSGLPVVRPLFFSDPTDLRLRNAENGFLLGDDLAVLAQTDPGVGEMTQLNDWMNLPSFADAPNLPKLMMRKGSIVPMGPPQEYTKQRALDPLWLIVCPDDNGKAEGRLYEDAGDGYGDHALTTYKFALKGTFWRIDVLRDGKFLAHKRHTIVEVLRDGNVISKKICSDERSMGGIVPIGLRQPQPYRSNGWIVGPKYDPSFGPDLG